MRKIINLFFVGFVGLAAFAEPTVTDVVAKQLHPWGLVDITCKVSGIDAAVYKQKFLVSAIMPNSWNVRTLNNYWVVQNGVKSTNIEVSADGDYRLLWDAKADLGEVCHSNMIVRITLGDMHEKMQLWENGPYWATTNIGAKKPEDYGYYFWWGDTRGYRRENNAWVSSYWWGAQNFRFVDSNTPTYGKISALQSEGWITASGVLAPEHDAAQEHWGGDWRMPTNQEFEDLISKCDWNWTTMNGVKGYVVRGRGEYASNSIFLPCAGYGHGPSLPSIDSESSLCAVGSNGYYWSSVPKLNSYDDGGGTWCLYFWSGYNTTYSRSRYYGQSVRPLQGFAK